MKTFPRGRLIVLSPLIGGLILFSVAAAIRFSASSHPGTAAITPSPTTESPPTESPLVVATVGPAKEKALPLIASRPVPSPTQTVESVAAPTTAPTPLPTAPATARLDPSPNKTMGTSTAVKVPILMYHYIRINPVASDRIGFGLSIPPAEFAAQMGWLASHGYHTVTVAEVIAALRGKGPLPSKPIALTFDDGYDDAYTQALPVLQRHRMVATFYIISGFVGHTHYMTWDQIRALDAAGMDIGAHTVDHLDLSRLPLARMDWEVTTSSATIAAQIHHPVLDFCYPSGAYNVTVEKEVSKAGFESATTVHWGYATRGNDLYALPRVRIPGGITLGQFASYFS